MPSIPPVDMADVSLRAVCKSFGAGLAVDRVDLEVPAGCFMALLGPSGCGKTTLLRLIAGLERPSGGSLSLKNRVVADASVFVEPEDRGLGMVFQSYALWPHMTAAENVAFALTVRRLAKPEIRRRVAEALSAVGLEPYGSRRPAALSGGQRQRVALARCLAVRPSLILLDEPLANLDAHLRESMQREFRRLHRDTGATFIYVTHDQTEAMALADRIAVMSAGRLQQVGSPQELYGRPRTAMVAGFIGRGARLPVQVTDERVDGRHRVRLGGTDILVSGAAAEAGRSEAILCLRPENVVLDRSPRQPEDGLLRARVLDTVYRGEAYAVRLSLDAVPGAVIEAQAGSPPEPDAAVGVRILDGWLIPAGAAP